MRRIIMTAIASGMFLLGQFGAGAGARAQGPAGDLKAIGPYGTVSYTRYFEAGETVTVAVVGAGRTDLDLFIYRPLHGRTVAEDEGDTDDCLVRFPPRAAGHHQGKEP